MRIVTQLIEAADSTHVWADQFDESSSDPLALQDVVAAKIVGTIAGERGQILRADYRAPSAICASAAGRTYDTPRRIDIQ